MGGLGIGGWSGGGVIRLGADFQMTGDRWDISVLSDLVS